MITFILNEDKSLLITQCHNIYQYEKQSTQLQFYLPKIIENIDIAMCTVSLRLLYPSGNGESIILAEDSNDNIYEDKICYLSYLPRNATLLPGVIELCLSIVSNDGKQILKTSKNELYILEAIGADEIIDDDDKDQLDWLTSQINELNSKKADNLISNEEDKTIQLEANGLPIGDKVSISGISGDDIIIFGG